jgi:branched-chain amino acid transport system substrate-binding protein
MTAWIRYAALVAAFVASADAVRAQEPVKIGIVMPMTGGLSSIGRQVKAGVELFMKQNGDIVAGRKIEVIFRDDAGKPEESRRLAQELIVNEKVDLLGAGLTPSALAIAPLATSAKVATVVMVSGTRIVTDRSPYLVRTSFTLGSQSAIMAGWARRNGSRRTVIVHSDWAPGAEAAQAFTETFTKAGGEIVETLKVPLANPDFAPFLQRARDARPDTIFVFVPTGQAGTFARQFVERGMDKAGIKLIGTGDITDDDDLPAMGDAVLGTVTAGVYSPAHDSNFNRNFVRDFMADNAFRPNHIALGGYDGMRLIYDTIKKVGVGDADKMVAAMKGAAWESPRGPISIDPATREIVQNIYIRRVEKRDGELQNIEFTTFEAVTDPATARQK